MERKGGEGEGRGSKGESEGIGELKRHAGIRQIRKGHQLLQTDKTVIRNQKD